MGIKVAELATRIDTIDEFIERTLNSDTLGCDPEFIRTNMFDAKKSILLAHGWVRNVASLRFEDFCTNGRKYLQDHNIRLCIMWKLLYDRYRAHMFLEHYNRTASNDWFLKSNYQKGPYSISYKMGFTIMGEHEIFYTEFFMDTDETYFIHQEDK